MCRKYSKHKLHILNILQSVVFKHVLQLWAHVEVICHVRLLKEDSSTLHVHGNSPPENSLSIKLLQQLFLCPIMHMHMTWCIGVVACLV